MNLKLAPERLLLILLLALTFVIYQPGMYGDYVFDDMSNITGNTKLIVKSLDPQAWYEASFSSFSGILKRPVSMFTFAVNASTTGLEAPLYFKLTNLLVHLLNGIAVYWLTALVTRRALALGKQSSDVAAQRWIPLLTTAIWLLHPLNLTPVLYIVQRMTSLAALFSFIGVGLYIEGRERLLSSRKYGWPLIWAGLIGAGALAALSKENGILIPLLLFVIEWTLFGFDAGTLRSKRLLKYLFVATVLIPTLVFIVATVMGSQRLYSSYAVRDFDMAERTFTQARVIWFYLGLALLPRLSAFGLYHDDFPLSHHLLEPWTTLVGAIGIGIVLVLALFVRKRLPVVALAILWFFAGHALESTTLPLELIHEHRNYLPLWGPAFALAYYGFRAAASADTVVFRRGGLILLIAVFSVVTALRADQWGNSVMHAITEASNHPQSERANQQLGRTYVLLADQENNNPEFVRAAAEAFEKAIHANDSGVVALVSLIQLKMRVNAPVDPTLLDELEKRLATKPQSPSVVPAMRVLVDCQLYSYCKFKPDEMARLFNALLNNPRAIIPFKSAARVFMAQYYVDVLNDAVAAITIMEEGLKESPENPDLLINLARIYRILHQFDWAEKRVDEARRSDRLGYRRVEIEEEAAKLARDRANAGVPSK